MTSQQLDRFYKKWDPWLEAFAPLIFFSGLLLGAAWIAMMIKALFY